MLCVASQDRLVMVERSDRMWSTGEGNGQPLQYSCLENPMNSMKKQKVMIPEDEPLGSGAQNATGEKQRNSSRKNEEAGSKQKSAQLWMYLMVKVKSDALKNNIA